MSVWICASAWLALLASGCATTGPTTPPDLWRCDDDLMTVTAELESVFFNDDFDDGGHRTEYSFSFAGERVESALDDDRTDLMRQGRPYTFVLQRFPWHGEWRKRVVEIREQGRTIFRDDVTYGVESRVTLDRSAKTLRFHYAGADEQILADDAVLALPLSPDQKYELGFQRKKLGSAFCTRLISVGQTDPTRTREVNDKINGPVRSPAVRLLWSRARD